MRALKIIVITLGVMIVVATGVLVAVIVGRVGKHEKPIPAAPRRYAAAPIDIPAGARIEAMTTGADRLIVGLALPDGAHRIVVIDLATGAPIGTIALRPSR